MRDNTTRLPSVANPTEVGVCSPPRTRNQRLLPLSSAPWCASRQPPPGTGPDSSSLPPWSARLTCLSAPRVDAWCRSLTVRTATGVPAMPSPAKWPGAARRSTCRTRCPGSASRENKGGVPRQPFLPIHRRLVLPVDLLGRSSLAALLCCVSPVSGDVKLRDDRVVGDPVNRRGGGHGVGEDG